jgi:protein SCO1/2
MKPIGERKKIFIVLLLLIGPGLVLIYLSKADHNFSILPYYGEREVVYLPDGTTDTLYHRVPEFTLLDHDSLERTWDDFAGKIIVADFFFTTCPTICPIMTKQMVRLQWLLEDPAYKDVHFLSHSVNPRHDTPHVLRKYGEAQGADFSRWTFLTGEQDAIFELGLEGYLLSTMEDDAAPGGFLHSSMFVLVDKDRHIRGFFDGTSTTEVDDLVIDIKMLLKQEKMKESEIVRPWARQ